MISNQLASLYSSGYVNEIDVHFAEFIARLDGRDDPMLKLAAAFLSRSAGIGHVCLDLNSIDRTVLAATGAEHPAVICPETIDWTGRLKPGGVVGLPGERRPLVLDDADRLYLYRYWRYEQDLIAAIGLRTGNEGTWPRRLDATRIKIAFDRLFPPDGNGREVDWQKVAALMALVKPFCVISGGPGTGKTHTVAKVLALLIEQAGDAHINVVLAAPTGKAAAKLSESMKSAVATLPCRAFVKERFPVEAQTLHRLLKPVPGTPYFQYDKNHPLPADVVIVDEASMVDLALMSKLVTAMSEKTRLVLIGDKDQLASVEAGAVLGDICDRENRHQFSVAFGRMARRVIGTALETSESQSALGIQDCVVDLIKNYRFNDRSGIGELSRAVKQGDSQTVLKLLTDSARSGIEWQPVASTKEFYRALEAHIIRGYREYLSAENPSTALERFNRFRILCAVNRGPRGVETLNRLAEDALRRRGLIRTTDVVVRGRWYAGRPVMVTANDYNVGVYNGDIGLTTPEEGIENSPLVVHMPGADGRTRVIPTARLASVETVFAMTIHKSQGSEFDRVHVVLPETDSAVLTRELIYTAVTRARSGVTIWGRESILIQAISRRIMRRSGLRDALWGLDSGQDGREGSTP